jgi:catechol 2,3-dioxygenase-like lactoylglutathione lyase family enzyme
MINGAHILIYSTNADADRVFFRDVLGFKSVDVGQGWLIFKLPPAEAAFHPGEESQLQRHGGRSLFGAVVYLMCDDVRATIRSLEAKKVKCSSVAEEAWGIKTTIRLPSGGEVGLYQPKHATAYSL